jgi:hypothetical protein
MEQPAMIFSKNYTPSGFYVYAYLRNDGTPYYIRKRSNKRAWLKHTGSGKLPNNLHRIYILEQNLTEIGALAIERRLIKWWGRKDLGTGILRNTTDGGDGLSNPSDEVRQLISKNTKKSLTGRKLSEEHKKNIGNASSNRTNETKKKIGDRQRGENHWTKREKNKDKKLFNGKNPMLDPIIVEKFKGPDGLIARARARPEVKEKFSGKNHWKYNNALYTFQNIDTLEIIHKTYSEFRKEFNCGGNLSSHINGTRSHVKRWKIIKKPHFE